MSNSSVLILGASGMLGSNCLRYLAQKNDIYLQAQYRWQENKDEQLLLRLGRGDTVFIEEDLDKFFKRSRHSFRYGRPEWIINAIGKIKPAIGPETPEAVAQAFEINTILPHKLAAAYPNSKIISIQTDCVFSGKKAGGLYEDVIHDDTTVYGRSKSCGEVKADNVYNIRCSIIGQEIFNKYSLVEWVLKQPQDAELQGFTEHLWSGVTCVAFAKLCYGIIQGKVSMKQLQHWVPANAVNKLELVSAIAQTFGRHDLKIAPKETPPCYRTLATLDPEHNKKMWEAAGYNEIPTVQKLVLEMAQFSSYG